MMAAEGDIAPPLTWFEFILQPQLLKAHIKRGTAAPGPKALLNAFVDQALSCCKAIMHASSRHALHSGHCIFKPLRHNVQNGHCCFILTG